MLWVLSMYAIIHNNVFSILWPSFSTILSGYSAVCVMILRILRYHVLSTVSSGYSAISAMVLEDVVKMKFKNLTEFRATMVSKLIGEYVCYIKDTM